MYNYVTHPNFQLGGSWLSRMVNRLPFRKPPPPRIDPNFFRKNSQGMDIFKKKKTYTDVKGG